MLVVYQTAEPGPEIIDGSLYVLNILSQVVVAYAFNGSDLLHSSQISRLQSCTIDESVD